MENPTNIFKIALIGDGGVGKTTLMKRHLDGDFESRYIATYGVAVSTLIFNTNYGPVQLDVHDYAGQEKFVSLEKDFIQVDGSIVMFDVTSRRTFKNVKNWIDRISSDGPIVLCGNKTDVKDRMVSTSIISSFIQKNGLKYYDISAKSNYNFDKPFVYLCSQLMKKDDLGFVHE